MTDDAIPAGKLPADMLARVLGAMGPMPPEVVLGPRAGEDACAIELPAGGGVLVAATDPITLTGNEVGRFAVVVNANDVAVMGVRPRWFLACVLLPEGITTAAVDGLFATMRDALASVGATMVGGHTEITAAVRQPVVVGQMLGFAESGRIVPTGGARVGDVVVQVGPVPVEGGAVLAAELGRIAGAGDATDVDGVADADVATVAGRTGAGRLPPGVLEAAAAGVDDPGISVVAAALAAADLGATALHDPTEGGLAGGLHELAGAAGVALRIDRSRVVWFEPAVAICRAVGADPWATLASGSLLACFPASGADDAVAQLVAQGHAAVVIGEAEPGHGVHDTEGRPLPRPARDEVARVLATPTTPTPSAP
jgi:hydrogenase expression/formation protein HypE